MLIWISDVELGNHPWKIKEFTFVKKDARTFTRLFYSAATEVEFDRQGRVNLPKNLIEFAKIDKECRVVGVSDRIEIWSSEQWNNFSEMNDDEFENIAEDLFDFGF